MFGISSGFVAQYYGILVNWLTHTFGPSVFVAPISLIIALLFFAIILSIIFSVYGYLFGWIERKLIARMQSRRGPTYVGKFGILQNLADLIKLVSKENIVPALADKPVFLTLIPLMLAIFVTVLAFIPLTSDFIGINTGIALIVVFLALSFMPLLVFLTGWTSGNKFSSIGAQRSVVMLISYEIPLIIVIASIAFLANGYNLTAIINAQNQYWFIVLMPIGFVVFFIALLAEIERPPFDLRDADSELIAGWLTDVSAPYYALALFIDYVRLFVGSLLVAILFLGGWLGPSFLPQFAWLIIKTAIVSLVIIVIRGTTVRMRVDQLLRFGWKYLMPLSIVNLLITYLLFVSGIVG